MRRRTHVMHAMHGMAASVCMAVSVCSGCDLMLQRKEVGLLVLTPEICSKSCDELYYILPGRHCRRPGAAHRPPKARCPAGWCLDPSCANGRHSAQATRFALRERRYAPTWAHLCASFRAEYGLDVQVNCHAICRQYEFMLHLTHCVWMLCR